MKLDLTICCFNFAIFSLAVNSVEFSGCFSNAVIPIRIHPIMMSIILHHYNMLKERTSSFDSFDNSSNDDNNEDIYDNNYNIDSKILKQELDKWYNFSFVLRKKNRTLFEEMLRSSYKYSRAIEVRGKENSTESLFMTLIFDQQKILLNSPFNNKIDCYL